MGVPTCSETLCYKNTPLPETPRHWCLPSMSSPGRHYTHTSHTQSLRFTGFLLVLSVFLH